MNVYTKQQRIAEVASRYPVVTTLSHHMDLQWLYAAYMKVRRDRAPGVDGETVEEYSSRIKERFPELQEEAKSGRYKAPPVKRVEIPKNEHEKRSIGIPTTEDAILQRSVEMLLTPIYESSFLECSYGFRPGRSAHQALEYMWKQIMWRKTGWIIDIDIRKYFDNIDHGHLRKILRHRVQDGVILRLIDKWLKAGVLEGMTLSYPEAGTPQGGIISPLLSNIYLDEVLDQWFEHVVRPELNGQSFMVRYADDAVLGFERLEDAERVLEALHKRFGKYGLSLHPEKTKLVSFVRPGARQCKHKDEKPETFDFLGFTHYWGKSRKGNQVVKRKTAHNRLSGSLRKVKEWCKKNRHKPLLYQYGKLVQKLRGHYAYYGITGNSASLGEFFEAVKRTWKKWLSRRSKRYGDMSWEKFADLLKHHVPLPVPKIVHSVFAAKP